MRRIHLALLALVWVSAAEASTWEIDDVHTSVQFSIRHLMISNVRGEFAKVSGTITADDADPTRSRITAIIDAASIDTREAKRDEHLRGADFLDVAKYPTITFASRRIERVGEQRWKVVGDLILHGVTREVTLDVEGPTPEVKDPWGNVKAGARATTRINRKDFGITWNKQLDGGGILVGDEVDITIEVEATRRQ